MKTVLSTEKKRILSTQDYSIFNLNETLSISKKHLERIKDSITKKNLCPDYPILVSDTYDILEGKYRFLACYELQLPIYYKIAEVTTMRDAIKLKQISRKTPVSEIVEMYKEIPSYGNILEICKEYEDKITIKWLLRVIQGASYTRIGDDFYSGEMSDWSIVGVRSRLDRVFYIMDYLGHPYFYDCLKACESTFGFLEYENKYSPLQMRHFKKYYSHKAEKSNGTSYQHLDWWIADFNGILKGDFWGLTEAELSVIGVKPKVFYNEEEIES